MIDASSAILLAKAGAIERCCEMFRLLMTRRVFDEVTVPHRPGAARLLALAGKKHGLGIMKNPVGPLPECVTADLHGLHRGERDSLHHCLDGAARFVIIDDGKGVRVCRRHCIRHINALLCPKLLLFSGRITERHAHLLSNRISDQGRYTTAVRNWAATCKPSDLSFFLG